MRTIITAILATCVASAAQAGITLSANGASQTIACAVDPTAIPVLDAIAAVGDGWTAVKEDADVIVISSKDAAIVKVVPQGVCRLRENSKND
jgi:hypothetical protein